MAFEALQAIVDAMPEGSWTQIPGTNPQLAGEEGRGGLYTKPEVDAIQASSAVPGINIWGNTGSRSVFTAEAGAAWDGKKMYFHTGGHFDYGGNEIYSFDFSHPTDLSQAWDRVIPPSPLTELYPNNEGDVPDTCRMPQDGPNANHTWWRFIYNPVNNSIMYLNNDSSGYCQNYFYPKTSRNIMWEFLLDSKTWIAHPSNPIYKTGHGMGAWYPPLNQMYCFNKSSGVDSAGPFAFDINGDMVRRGDVNSYDNRACGMIYNPNDGLMYTTHQYEVRTKDPSGNPLVRASVDKITVPQAILDQSPLVAFGWFEGGWAFDEARNTILLWTGIQSTWVFDCNTKLFTEHKNLNGSIFPTKQDRHIYNKFVYIPEVDAYVGGMVGDEDLWVYKLDNATGGTPNVLVSMRGKVGSDVQMGVKGAINAPAGPQPPVAQTQTFIVTGSPSDVPVPGLLAGAIISGTVSGIVTYNVPATTTLSTNLDGSFTISDSRPLPVNIVFSYSIVDEYGGSEFKDCDVLIQAEAFVPIRNLYVGGVQIEKVFISDDN